MPRSPRLLPEHPTVLLLAGGPSDHPELRDVATGVFRQAELSGVAVVLIPFEDRGEANRHGLAGLQRDSTVGVLAFGHGSVTLQPPAWLERLPHVWIDPREPRAAWMSVEAEREASAAEIVGVLTSLGHRRIGYLGERSQQETIDPWRRPVGQALLLSDVFDADMFVAEQPDAAGGRRAGHRVLDQPSRPTAVICRNGRVAMGAYAAADDLGLSIPEDVSVLALDDADIAAVDLRPPLAAVRAPYHEMGAAGLRLLLDDLAWDRRDVLHLTCAFVHRDSIARRG